MRPKSSGMTPLVCSCGCGQSIEGRHENARYTSECAAKRRLELKRLTRKVWRGREREERRALNPTQHVVIHRYDVNPHHPQRLCQVCSGMPWRRDGVCRGCGEPPGDETIQRGSVLRSSAGTAVDSGRYHGHG